MYLCYFLETTRLHKYCRDNKFGDVYQMLSISCANVNAKDHAGCTPLHIACQAGSFSCVKVLIEETAESKSFNQI